MTNIRFVISKLLNRIFSMPSINNSQLHQTCRIGTSSAISNTIMGMYSYCGEHTNISMAEIGKFTSISAYCSIGGGAHPVDWVSTSPVFTAERSILRTNFTKNSFATHKKTYIGSDVWIGAHALIKSGVSIGNGAVIGMGSVVTKDVGPYEIWAGNPAKLIRKRFDDNTIEALLSSEWWNWSEEKLRKYADKFNSTEAFLNDLERNKK